MQVLDFRETRDASFSLDLGCIQSARQASQSASPWGVRLTALCNRTCVNASC